MGIEPTGEEMEVTIMSFQRIENGKVTEEWQVVDTLGIFQQLGVVEPLDE